MSVRVFVSHSAKDEKAKAIQAALVKELGTEENKKHFTLLMDKYTLKPGDAWRAHINLWLGACDVAVVLLSEPALISAYVMYELSVLSYRRSQPGSKFVILPVYIGKVDAGRLKKSRLDPTQLTEIEAFREQDPEKLAALIVNELTQYGALDERPIDRVVDTIRTLLDGIPETPLKKAMEALAMEIPWQADADLTGIFALRLLSVGMEAAMPALIKLRPALKNEPETMQQLVHLVACSWVDMKAVGQLPRVARAPAGRAVALNADDATTAQMYHIAASSGEDTWMFTTCSTACQPKPNQTFAEALVETVAEQLRTYLSLKPSANLKNTLKILSDSGQVVLVAMPWAGLDESCVRKLEDELGGATFFFLTGATAAEVPVDESLLQLIIPALQPGDEPEFLGQYEVLNTAVMIPMQVNR